MHQGTIKAMSGNPERSVRRIVWLLLPPTSFTHKRGYHARGRTVIKHQRPSLVHVGAFALLHHMMG